MCDHCNYSQLMESSGLEPTANRLKVFEVIGNNNSPLNAREIFNALNRTTDINRVTIYRILKILEGKGLIRRVISGDRSHRFGMAPNAHHRPHAHFFCKRCKNLECLNPECLQLDMTLLERTFPGTIEGAQIRIDGICKNCLKRFGSEDYDPNTIPT